MKEIKRQFFTYRNGALADTLRGYGDPHKIIFGLDVPRIAAIAASLTPSLPLAEELWADRDVRESRLLAAYLFPVAEVDMERALGLAADVRDREEADMLSFRLFKRLPFARELYSRLKENVETALAASALGAHLS